MARKIYPYSLDRKDAKIAGVCSTLGRMIGIDPTFLRIGFVARRDLHQLQADADRLCRGRHLFRGAEEEGAQRRPRKSDFDRMDDVVGRKPDNPRDAQRPRRDRPPADGDRSSHQHPERRAGARNRSAPRRRSDGPDRRLVLGAASSPASAAPSWAGLKAWNGWLDLKRFELTHDAATAPAPGGRTDRDRGPSGTRPQARSDRRGHRYISSPGADFLPKLRFHERRSGYPPFAGPPLKFPGPSIFQARGQADLAARERCIILELARGRRASTSNKLLPWSDRVSAGLAASGCQSSEALTRV